jgi:murein DD-endopeptidase MepM/ murein hydrolase activator NlpD
MARCLEQGERDQNRAMSSISSVLARQQVGRRGPRLHLEKRKTQTRSKATNILPFPVSQSGVSSRLTLVGIVVAALVLLVSAYLAFRQHQETQELKVLLIPNTPVGEAALADYVITEPIRSSDAAAEADLPTALRIRSYTVRRGDSLSSIAQKFGLRVDTLISYNGIKRARGLLAGTEMRVPSADGLAYTVRRGDTLGGIAGRFGVSLNDLLDWNNLESEVIRIGQALFIPGGRLSATQRDMVLGRLFVYPTRGDISSRFGWRINPFTGTREHHNGLDISNSAGTPVRAAMAGRVAMVGVNPVYGKYVIIQHAEGFQTLYAHLHSTSVSRGARVSQSQRIASMGNTGYSTGPHLHFTIFRNNVPVDPLRYLH